MSRDALRLTWADVTPRRLFLDRRAFLAGAAALTAGPAAALTGKPSPVSTDAEPNSFDEITNYNNFYEFGTGKTDPAENAGKLTVTPWSVAIDGLVDRPGSYAVEDLAPEAALEERIYRLRCVEAWSMVIPWLGVPLAAVLAKAAPRPGARYVAFETVMRP